MSAESLQPGSEAFLTQEGPTVGKPIEVCMDVAEIKEQIGFSDPWEVIERSGYDPDEVVNIKFGADSQKLMDKRMSVLGVGHPGGPQFAKTIISAIDERPKQSGMFWHEGRYQECTGVVASGLRASDGVRISFLSHQAPVLFLGPQKATFTKQLTERLHSLKAQCVPGSVDMAIFGGQPEEWLPDLNMEATDEGYEAGIDLLSTIAIQELGIRPLVIVAPHTYNDRMEAFFNTRDNQLHVRSVPKGSGADKMAGAFTIDRYRK